MPKYEDTEQRGKTMMYRWGYQSANYGTWTHGVDDLEDLSSNLWHALVDKCDDLYSTFRYMGVPDPNHLYEQLMNATEDDEAERLHELFGNVCAEWSYTYEGTLAMLSYDRQAAYLVDEEEEN